MSTNQPGNRLLSLDVFRGATIASMMLVNNAGDHTHTYAPLLHARWDGWTFTDTVFPFFLWISGVAMTLSFARRVERGDDRHQLMLHVLKRSAIIFLIGLFLHAFPIVNFSTIRILGVLQRIGLCYLIAGAIFLYTGLRGQVLWLLGLLAVYWGVMMYFPVPGFGAGVLTIEGSFAGYLDRMLLPGHLYTPRWDPEGIVSTLPSIATVLFGVMTGHVLRGAATPQRKTLRLLAGGVVLVLAGQVLDTWMPINKNLWTVSFSLFMAGLASVLFALWYWLLDVKGWLHTVTRPLAIYGMNALAVYIAAGILYRLVSSIKSVNLFRTYYAPLGDPYQASLYWGLTYVLALYGIAYFLYRRKWFLRF